ncbi:hypothetical protein SAMN05878482_105192 [Peribacillus simplex]|uniref:Uncharacterized protein n=1 Tax=Peribacillus simplex TaxID=1478 RepID=A0A9X8RB70_9BACI|nr:hypothetical protein [Peribacillus simplex]SIR72160.1 hypothetical protein SAMN05878482_105192 [Peribacillus simplex]
MMDKVTKGRSFTSESPLKLKDIKGLSFKGSPFFIQENRTNPSKKSFINLPLIYQIK